MWMPSRSAYWVSGASIRTAVCRTGRPPAPVGSFRSARAAQQATGQLAGRLPVLERDGPRLDRGHVARGLLEQPPAARRQVGLHVGRAERQALVVDEVDVAQRARLQGPAVRQPVE